jgi:hypothetical protein
VISVTAETPIVDTAKIDIGRNIGEREVKNLPLVSRNPYNFALLQPGVTGFENQEFGVPRFAANGTLLRVNYQIDGNTNTQKDRAGLRLLPVSEVMVREVKVVTSGYAPEFGQTMGLVYNAITPSGTNTFPARRATASAARTSARSRSFTGPRTDDRKPDTKIDTWTAELGGPVLRDRTALLRRASRAPTATCRGRARSRSRPRTPRASACRRSPRRSRASRRPGSTSASSTHQLGRRTALTGRYIRFENDSPNNIGGGLNSTEVSTDFLDAMNSAAFQVVSTFGNNRLNELRVQFANRHQSRRAATAVGHRAAHQHRGRGQLRRPQRQRVGRRLRLQAEHLAGDQQLHLPARQPQLQVRFRHPVHRRHADGVALRGVHFPSIDAYLAARSGANPQLHELPAAVRRPGLRDGHGDVQRLRAGRLARDARLQDALRRPLRHVPLPGGDATRRSSGTATSAVDRNNFGPRLGIAWTPFDDKRTVVRASTGIMYDQPLLAAYELAFQNSGSPARFTVNVGPTSAGAPAFPGNLANCRPASRCRRSRSSRSTPTSRSRARSRTTCSSSGARPRLRGVDRLRLRQGLRPAGHHQHQPDQPGRRARRRPADLQHAGQRQHAALPAVQPGQRGAVDRRLDLPRDDAPAQQAVVTELPVRPDLHARQGRRQRADDLGAVGAG